MATKTVIDLSKWNEIYDYSSFSAMCDGVLLRIGYRSSKNNGKIMEDEKFHTFLTGFNNVKCPVGVYFFTEAISNKEAVEEVSWVLKTLKRYHLEPMFPIAVDTEWVNSNKTGRSDKLNKNERTDYVISFCEEIKKGGYKPIIYASDSWFVSELDYARVKGYDKWVSRYSRKKPERATDNVLGWQKTNDFNINGAKQPVDMSEWYGPISKAFAKFGNASVVDHQKTIELQEEPLYVASASPNPTRKASGTYYIWSDEIINGKIRITTKEEYVGVLGKVTGWIKAIR